MAISAYMLDDWTQFKLRIINDLFPDGKFRRGEFLFRGHGDESWPLVSSFDRWYQGARANKAAVAKTLLKQFSLECEHEDIPEAARNHKATMLGLAQHYGLPTRMLDWTESPYVAAFFAYSNHIRHGIKLDKHVAVWVLDRSNYAWQKESGCEIMDVPSFGNERIKNQHGKFTYLKAPYDSLEEYISHFPDSKALRKYLVPVRDVACAMAELDAMGINHARIFPGIAGNAKAAEVRVMLSLL